MSRESRYPLVISPCPIRPLVSVETVIVRRVVCGARRAPSCEERTVVLRTSSASTELFLQSIIGKFSNPLIPVREVLCTIPAIGRSCRDTAATTRYVPDWDHLGCATRGFSQLLKARCGSHRRHDSGGLLMTTADTSSSGQAWPRTPT